MFSLHSDYTLDNLFTRKIDSTAVKPVNNILTKRKRKINKT